MLITESYRDLNKQLHEANPHFGVSGARYVASAWSMIDQYGSTDILDYGCGKRTLEAELKFPIANYDPAIAGLNEAPEPHDVVMCTDVLEHIEPDCLDEVLADIRRVTRKGCFLVVSTAPAQKTLADGRNAHLIQQPFAWWKDALQRANLEVKHMKEAKREFAVVCE